MTTRLGTNRKLGTSTTVPLDFSDKIGYVAKSLTTEFGTLCVAPSAVGALANTNAPLGIIEYVDETTAANIASAAAAVIAGDDPAPYFKRATIISDGYADAIAGDTITPGTHSRLKVDGNGRVIPVTGAETGPFWIVGWVDTPKTSGAQVTVGQRIQIVVRPQIIFLAA